jgi:hypothetical protein
MSSSTGRRRANEVVYGVAGVVVSRWVKGEGEGIAVSMGRVRVPACPGRVLARSACSGHCRLLLGQGSRQQVQGDEVSLQDKVREREEGHGEGWHGGDQVGRHGYGMGSIVHFSLSLRAWHALGG